MTHPSPLAIQFLYDLRRVVDIAKERIRQRRFIPALPIILEDADNEKSYEDEEIEEKRRIQEQTTSEESLMNATTTPESSPRSEQKSVDSGRESKDDSEEDGDEVEERKEEIIPKAQTKVSDIVKCKLVFEFPLAFHPLQHSKSPQNPQRYRLGHLMCQLC